MSLLENPLYGRKFTLVTDHKPLVWFHNSKDPCSRVTRWKLKLTEYDFDVAYKAGITNVNADNNKGSIEINSIEQRSEICMSDFEREEKVPEIHFACYEKMDYDITEENIEEINFIKSKKFMNGANMFENKINRRNYDELKYKVIEDENIDNGNFGGNEQMLINGINVIKNIKSKGYNNNINYLSFIFQF